jgi:hypothetical protein
MTSILRGLEASINPRAVQLAADGTWNSGRLVGTMMVDPGLAQIDPGQQALSVVRDLSRTDFGACGVDISPTGELSAPIR